jgi:hypothetical protein
MVSDAVFGMFLSDRRSCTEMLPLGFAQSSALPCRCQILADVHSMARVANPLGDSADGILDVPRQ